MSEHWWENLVLLTGRVTKKYALEHVSVNSLDQPIKEENLRINRDPVNPPNIFGSNSVSRKIQLLPDLKEYFTPKGGPEKVKEELQRRIKSLH
ncbi:hypothetical protein FRX31_019439 [Thalictrum thalictroides]|uniref:Uncharacterized protein n=1 Tax=Thalictrum thalictroides TaxID=46969 RepID=A0A7J6W0S5_THATH|nr:hypothetical protein FRX31_019439 [Thalictrum thalictroides]